MNDIFLAIATPVAMAAAWFLYHLGDFDAIRWVRAALRWSARTFVVIAYLAPPAGAAAVTWIVTQEQERLAAIVEPMLEHLVPTTTAP